MNERPSEISSDEIKTREGRNRSRNDSAAAFRRRCRSTDVMGPNGVKSDSMSSLEMEADNFKSKTPKYEVKPYSDLDIKSLASGNGTRRNYSDVYSEVNFLPGGFRHFPRPPRNNLVVAQHVSAIDAGQKPPKFDPPTPPPPEATSERVYREATTTDESSEGEPAPADCLGIQAMKIKPVPAKIEIVKVEYKTPNEDINEEDEDVFSDASTSDCEIQSVIDSSCYERHDPVSSYVCTEVTALDKVEPVSDVTEVSIFSDSSTRATSIRTEELNMKLSSLVSMEKKPNYQHEDIQDATSPVQAVQSWLDQAPSQLGTPESVRSVRSSKVEEMKLSKSESVFQILNAYRRKDYSDIGPLSTDNSNFNDLLAKCEKQNDSFDSLKL